MDYDYQKLIINLIRKLILSQTELGKLLGVSYASVNRWEKGHHEPTIKIKREIIKICKKNKVDMIYKNE